MEVYFMSALTEQLKDTTNLDEKLRLIDEMMKAVTPQKTSNGVVVPVDPMENLLCQSCQ